MNSTMQNKSVWKNISHKVRCEKTNRKNWNSYHKSQILKYIQRSSKSVSETPIVSVLIDGDKSPQILET